MKTPKVSIGIGKHLKFSPGDQIFLQGDTGSEMYVVASGQIRIFLSTRDQSITLAILKKGDFFGEMALLENLPRSAGAEALVETELIALETNDFKFLIQQHPEIALKILARFSNRLRAADQLIGLLLMGDVSAHVLHCVVHRFAKQFGMHNKWPKECLLSATIEELAEEIEGDFQDISKVFEELSKIGMVTQKSDGIHFKRLNKLKYYFEHFGWKPPK